MRIYVQCLFPDLLQEQEAAVVRDPSHHFHELTEQQLQHLQTAAHIFCLKLLQLQF